MAEKALTASSCDDDRVPLLPQALSVPAAVVPSKHPLTESSASVLDTVFSMLLRSAVNASDVVGVAGECAASVLGSGVTLVSTTLTMCFYIWSSTYRDLSGFSPASRHPATMFREVNA